MTDGTIKELRSADRAAEPSDSMSALHSSALQAAHAAERSWYEDGFENIYRGLLLLLLSVDFMFPESAFSNKVYAKVQPFFELLGIAAFAILLLSHRSLVEWIKTKITFPRSGYSAPPPSAVGVERQDTGFWPTPLPTFREEEYLARQQKMRLCLYTIFALVFLSSLVKLPYPRLNVFVAISWTLIFAFASRYTQPPGRPAWTAFGICIFSGLAVLAFHPPDVRPAKMLFPLLGGISVVIGIWQLTTFLLNHPRNTLNEA